MAALDTGLAFYEPKLPPPSMLPGSVVYGWNNREEMKENAMAALDALKIPTLKLGAHGDAGVKCTQDTQPRDANGRFAHCSHAR